MSSRITTAPAIINLLRRALKYHRLLLAIVALLLAVFPILVSAAVTTIDVEGVFGAVQRTLPPFFQETFGQEMALTLTSRGLLVFAWNHPIVHALLAAVMVALASRAIAGEIEGGTMELLLSQPLSRPAYLAAQSAFAGLVLLGLITLMLCGVHAGISLFDVHAQVSWRLFLPVAVNLFSLETAIYGVTLAFSSGARESGRVVTIALLIIVLSYLIQAVARLWSKIDFLLKFSIFEYYSPQRTVLLGEAPWLDIAVLLLVGFSLAGAGWWRFMRRDVP
jgi:ABC-2 type transport system permease protein